MRRASATTTCSEGPQYPPSDPLAPVTAPDWIFSGTAPARLLVADNCTRSAAMGTWRSLNVGARSLGERDRTRPRRVGILSERSAVAMG